MLLLVKRVDHLSDRVRVSHDKSYIMRILKFLVSGFTAAAVEYGVYIVLHSFFAAEWIVLSQTISFLTGFVVSFLLNKNWVFESSGAGKSQLVKYSLLAGINLFLSNVALWLFVENLDWNHLLAKFIVMGMVAAWNYLLFSRLIFAEKK